MPADVVPRRHRLSERSSDLGGQILSATVRLLQTNPRQITHFICPCLSWGTLCFSLCLLNLSCDWSDRAVKRLEAARVQKNVAEATKVIKQQELHKSLRVRWWIETFDGEIFVMHRVIITSSLSNRDNNKNEIKCYNFKLGLKKKKKSVDISNIFFLFPSESQQLLQSDRWFSTDQLLPLQPRLQNAGHSLLVPEPGPLELAKVERWRLGCQLCLSLEHKLNCFTHVLVKVMLTRLCCPSQEWSV